MRIIHDEVYGPTPVISNLLRDLLESRAVQRLKRISQAGASPLVTEGRDVTRYEHSVGVMILVGKLGGSEIEQAAGLLQDVSHTAFSHTVDRVYGDQQEEFHERIFQSVIENSDIPEILEKYELSWRKLFAAENLARVDVSAPGLCADRIDYTLRDLVRFKYISAEEACGFVDSLEFRDGKIVVSSVEQAWTFANWYSYLVGKLFMDPLELYANDELARIIRDGLKADVLEESDLLETDELILGKLTSGGATGLTAAFDKLRNTQEVSEADVKGSRIVYSKARVVDPLVRHEGKLVPLSDLRADTRKLYREIKRKARDGVRVGPRS